MPPLPRLDPPKKKYTRSTGYSRTPTGAALVKKQVIKRVAARLFAERGVAAVGLASVGMVAQLPNRGVNYYYRNREDLVGDGIDLGLVDEFKTVSSFASKPVKVTMTGPHLLSAVAFDEYYNDISRMISDYGKLLRQNLKRLAEAGCKHIQIDEPYLTPVADDEVRSAVDAINLAIEDLPDDVHVMVHICQGNYAVGPDYDGQIGHRYFDQGRYKADLVCKIECDGYLIEHDMTPHYESCLGNRQLAVGAIDVQSPNIETGEQVVERIKVHKWLAPEQTMITSTCGFNHLPRHIAMGKLKAMTAAKAILNGSTKRSMDS